MKLLENKILTDGKVLEGDILKVDNFLNHQIDVALLNELGREFYRLFINEGITKIVTIEASGIGVACIAAQYFNVPVVFAKKTVSLNISTNVYTAKVTSFTKKKTYDAVISKEFLHPTDKVLIIDDFLAQGSALEALISIVTQSGASVAGAGIIIEKAYQGGGDLIRSKGIRVESLARIKSMSHEKGITFC